MLISKEQGERLSVKELSAVYGGCCGGTCGNCDCTSSGGDKFYDSFDPEMTDYNGNLMSFSQP